MKSACVRFLFLTLAIVGMPAVISAAGNHDRKDSKKPQIATVSTAPRITEKSYEIDVDGQLISFIGTVTLYGNEPHSWTGVSPEKSKEVYSIAPAAAAMDLRTVQGYRIQFTGVLQKPSADRLPGSGDADLFVSSWHIVQ